MLDFPFEKNLIYLNLTENNCNLFLFTNENYKSTLI